MKTMPQPLPTRKEGEWRAGMEEVFPRDGALTARLGASGAEAARH